MPLVPPGKTIDHTKSRVRRDAEGKVTAVRVVFTDGTETIVSAGELATPDKRFDEGLEAEDTYHEMVDAFERYIKTEDGIRAIEAEKFGYNVETISEISHKKRAGTTVTTEEKEMYKNYNRDIMKIMAAIENRMNALPNLNKVMMKVAKVRKHVGEIFKYSSDEQERILSSTWFSGDGAMILTGIPGVGKSQYIVSAMLLLCNGMNNTELNHARRQHARFRDLIKMQETFLASATSRLRDAHKKESEAREQRDTSDIEKAEKDIRTLKVEESNAKNALSKFRSRERGFLDECEKKMLRHSAITRLDPDKSPEEILYWTRVSMREVKVGAPSKEQEYAFTPMPREIVLKPIKFFNEANRMNIATQDAVLGLMAEHEIEYLGETFKSLNSQAKFVNSDMDDSWLWTENIASDDP